MEGHFCFEEDFFDKEECSKIVSSTREVVHQEKLPGVSVNIKKLVKVDSVRTGLNHQNVCNPSMGKNRQKVKE